MQNAVQELGRMGQMPSDYEEIDDETLAAYERLLKEIKMPIGVDDAEQLVLLFPETGLFGAEWTLLHIFETLFETLQADGRVYRGIVERCPADEWRETLLKRLDNRLADE